MKILGTAILAVILVMVVLFGYRQWWVDTHCTTILGTQVCDTGQPAQQPAPPSASSPVQSLAGITQGPRGGVFYVNCLRAQCTTEPGAGPFGATCVRPGADDKQLCTMPWARLADVPRAPRSS